MTYGRDLVLARKNCKMMAMIPIAGRTRSFVGVTKMCV